MRAHILINVAKPRTQVVGIADEKSAGFISKLAKPAVRIQSEQIFIALQLPHHRTVRVIATTCSLVYSSPAQRIDLADSFTIRTIDAQPRGINRIDADIRPICSIDDRTEVGLHSGRDRKPFGKEYHRFAAWTTAERIY